MIPPASERMVKTVQKCDEIIEETKKLIKLYPDDDSLKFTLRQFTHHRDTIMLNNNNQHEHREDE